MKIYDTLQPQWNLEYVPNEYAVCMDFNHLCRYRGLRQLVHDPSSEENRLVTLETPNPFESNAEEFLLHSKLVASFVYEAIL